MVSNTFKFILYDLNPLVNLTFLIVFKDVRVEELYGPPIKGFRARSDGGVRGFSSSKYICGLYVLNGLVLVGDSLFSVLYDLSKFSKFLSVAGIKLI